MSITVCVLIYKAEMDDHSLFYLLFPVLGRVHNVRTLVLSRGAIPGSNVQNALLSIGK